MSDKGLLVSGTVWSVAGRVSQQVLGLIVLLILARMVSPEDFGLVAMPTIFIGFANLLADFGFGASLVQQQDSIDKDLPTIFVVNIVIGCILSIVFFASAPLIAGFYKNEAVIYVSQQMSVNFILVGISVVPVALLTRAMDFRSIAVAELLSALMGGIVAVSIASAGSGISALIVQVIVTNAVRMTCVWVKCGWTPKIGFSAESFARHARFSVHLLGFNGINYWARNADDLITGRFLGADALGIYSKSYMIMMLPLSQIMATISRVMFPALSRIKDDLVEVRELYVRASGMGVYAAAPLLVCLSVSADDLVFLALGSSWGAAAPIIRILCIASLCQVYMNPVGWIYMSQGRTRRMFRWGVLSSCISVGAILYGAHLGSITTIAWAYSAANLMLMFPTLIVAFAVIDLPVGDVFRYTRPCLVAALAMFIVGLMLSYALENTSHLTRVATISSIGSLIYVAFLHIQDADPYFLLLHRISGRLGVRLGSKLFTK